MSIAFLVVFLIVSFYEKSGGRVLELSHIVVFVSWLAGGFISGATALGGAMVAFPIASLLVPVHTLIPLACLLNVVMCLGLACLYGRWCRVREVWPMLLGAVPGSFLGLELLQVVSAKILLACVGTVLLFYTIWQSLSHGGKEHAPNFFASAAAGFFSGALGSSISFDGPPAGIYALYRGWSPHEALGTLSVYFLLRNIVGCVLLLQTDLVTPDVVSLACYGVPSVILGTLIAYPVAKHLNIALFRKALTAIIGCAGIICLVRAF